MMIKNNYIFIIYICLLSIVCKEVQAACNQAAPSFYLASQNLCSTYESITISSPNSYTSLTIDGYTPSVDSVNTRLVFNNLKAGLIYLNYTYFDSADKSIMCYGNKSFTALPRSVSVVQQPKCPWNQVQVVPAGDTSTTFSVNNVNTYPRDQVVATKPGTNFARGSNSGCYYYFEVMPQTSTVPSIKVTPNTCGKTVATVTVSNFADYSSLTLVGTNLTAINGVFSAIASGNYVLNATSVSCGVQLISVVVVTNSPPVNIVYTPVPCSGNGLKQVNATFSVAGYPNANYDIDNSINLDGNTITLNQSNQYTVYWYDAATECEGSSPLVVLSSTTPITFTVNPPLSTYSQPSVVTINYPGNYSDLKINGGDYVLNGTQFTTDPNNNNYNIGSSCYANTISLSVPILQPNFQITYGSCFAPASVTVSNYYYYSSISLTLINGNLTLVSTNGSFPNVPIDGTYLFNATEKVSTPGVAAQSYTTNIGIRIQYLNTGYITYKVEYVKLPLSCRSNDGTVKLTPIYNDSVTVLTGDTTTVAYGLGQSSTFNFSSQCPQILSWSSEVQTFNISYTITNATVNQKASIAINTYAPINNIIINGYNVFGSQTPYPIKVYGDTQYNAIYLNYITVTYTDNCQYSFYPVAYSVAPVVTPALEITPQRSDNCLVKSGMINITNAPSFDSLQLVSQGQAPGPANDIKAPAPGTYPASSGLYTLIYKIGNTTANMTVIVPNTDGVTLSTTVTNPTCSSYYWFLGRNLADSYVNFKLTNTSSNTQLPVTAFVAFSLPMYTFVNYYPSTQQVVGLMPYNYTGYVQSFFCNWVVNFTINPQQGATFTITVNKTLGSNDGVLIVGNPENRNMNGITSSTTESSNYKQVVDFRNFNGTAYVGIRYNEMCNANIYQPLVFAYPVKPTYQLLPSGKCGTALIQYDQATIDNYNILLDGSLFINSTTPLELMVSQISATYTNIHNYDVINTVIYVQPVSTNNINYTFIPATCSDSNDGRVVINNPDPTVVYTAYDDWNECDVAYNTPTHSFEGLYARTSLEITATKMTSKGLVVCDVAYAGSVQFDGEVPQYLVPTLQIMNSCDGKSNGHVVIGSINTTNVMQGTFIINGTTYTNSSIDLPVGYYQMTIPQMHYDICTYNQDFVPTDEMSTAVMGIVGSSPPLKVFNFQIKQASPISIKQLSSPKDNCGLVTIQGTGGSGNYTFELYYQSNNTMIGSQVSDVNGQVKFTIPSSASSLTFKVIAKDQSSCMTSTINVKGDCTINSSSSLSISFFFILLSIISLLLI